MHSNEAVLVALVVVLIMVVAFRGGGFGRACPAGCGCARCAAKAGFASNEWAPSAGGAGPPPGTSTAMSPYTPLHMQDGAARGQRHDAYGQDRAFDKADLAKNYRAWATTPRDLEEAQRAAWFETVSNGNNASYNPEAGGDTAAELFQHHEPGPSINYQDTLVDLVSDPRMRAQQANWHSEVAPKSQTALQVDTIDEAAAMSSYNGHGIYAFRMDAPSQHNPLFITDQDAESYGAHATKFTFGG